MTVTATVRTFVIAASVALTCFSSSVAAEMVSIKGNIVNLRSRPSTQGDRLWELTSGYPLRVLKRQGKWLQVQDFENDRGWVYRPLTSHAPHHIVKANVANIRSGPGTKYRVVARANRGDLLRTQSKKAGWVKVQQPDGQLGWISKKLVWGW